MDDPFFDAAMKASDTLYKFLGDGLQVVHPPHKFRVEGKTCFRPSAAMLTSLEMFPNAVAIDFSPGENRRPFIDAIDASDGQFVYSNDNEVLFVRDVRTSTGCVSPSCSGN